MLNMQTVKCVGYQNPEPSVYVGEVVPSAKYDPPNSIRMSTGILDFPFRVISLTSIFEVDENPFHFEVKPDSMREVQGSHGNVYTVRTSNGITTCTCPGFEFRKICKHIKIED